MKHNISTIKEVLSLLMALCMMACLASCLPHSADPTEPGVTGTTQLTDGAEETTVPASETQETTVPTDTETEHTPAEPPQTKPTFAAAVPKQPAEPIFSEIDETVYAITTVNIRTGPDTDCEKTGSLAYSKSIQRTGISDNGWSRVIYNGEEAYIYSAYLTDTKPTSSSLTTPGSARPAPTADTAAASNPPPTQPAGWMLSSRSTDATPHPT